VTPHRDVREVAERRGVGRDDRAVGGPGGGGDDEVVSSSGDALATDGHEQGGVGGGDIEVVAQDRNSRDDVVHERLTPGAASSSRQLDADAQFGHRDRGDGDVILVRNEIVEVIAGSLRIDEEGRVEEQPAQDRSSTSMS